MGWKDKFTFKEKHAVEQQVGENTLRFYPNRIHVLPELAELSKPIAAALATLFAEKGNDAAVSDEKIESPEGTIRRSTVQAISPETIKARDAQLRSALGEVLDVLADKRNCYKFGVLIMDSLREVFPHARDRSPELVEEFLFGDGEPDGHPGFALPEMAQLIRGWIAANTRQFGDTGKILAAAVESRLGGLRSNSPSEETTEMPAGSSSKTPSSSLSLVGSESSS